MPARRQVGNDLARYRLELFYHALFMRITAVQLYLKYTSADVTTPLRITTTYLFTTSSNFNVFIYLVYFNAIHVLIC